MPLNDTVEERLEVEEIQEDRKWGNKEDRKLEEIQEVEENVGRLEVGEIQVDWK